MCFALKRDQWVAGSCKLDYPGGGRVVIFARECELCESKFSGSVDQCGRSVRNCYKVCSDITVHPCYNWLLLGELTNVMLLTACDYSFH